MKSYFLLDVMERSFLILSVKRNGRRLGLWVFERKFNFEERKREKGVMIVRFVISKRVGSAGAFSSDLSL